ncbi:MAG: response regulator, partial [Lachnospiraceae bacterium]|nr:response regulator [Lachnospiraceae bacterium]
MKRFQGDFYRRLFESLDNNAVMMRVEEDGTYYPIWCSKEFTEMMEGEEADFIRLESGGTMSTIHPEDHEAVSYLFRHHKTKDGTNSLTIRKYTVKGKEIWVHVHYSFVMEEGVQYAYCTYADITEIKKREQIAETARREREALRILHGMLNSGPWYMDFDEQGNMISVTWTDTFRKMLGYESEEDFPNVLESWSDLLHEEDKERVLKEYNQTIHDRTGQAVYDVEYQLLTKNRGWRWFHAVGQLSRRPDGSPVTYVGMFVDITEKKEAEAKLSERNELLANALREAEQANVAKTAFLSNMSHEIRTPMNAIIGLDSIALKEPGLSERTREQLVKIGGSAKHLLSLINDILDMSRIESGRMTIRNEEFSFSDMLEQINTMIHSQCQDKGLTYECRIVGHVNDYYIGDDMKLKQVIINILGNAVKFTEAPGTVSFIVEQVSSYENQTVMRFIMKDTGIGMDKEYLPKIFDAFSQENEGTSNKYGSTGLGMAITKNIVEMMNGNISVTSEKGVGTEFTVNVTLKNSDRRGHDMESVKPQEMHVLIIDDDAVACEHAKLILEEVGISADICLSGKEALEMIELRHARQEPYNLILVDWKMPELNGVEVTRRIREEYGDEFTVVILTSFNWDEIMEEAIGAGVDSFIAKPLFASNILTEFTQIMKRKKEDEKIEHRVDITGRRVLIAEDMIINAEILKEVLAMRDVEADHAENGEIVIDMFQKSEENYYDAILMDVRMPVMGGLDATKAIRALERKDAKEIPIIAMTANA